MGLSFYEIDACRFCEGREIGVVVYLFIRDTLKFLNRSGGIFVLVNEKLNSSLEILFSINPLKLGNYCLGFCVVFLID